MVKQLWWSPELQFRWLVGAVQLRCEPTLLGACSSDRGSGAAWISTDAGYSDLNGSLGVLAFYSYFVYVQFAAFTVQTDRDMYVMQTGGFPEEDVKAGEMEVDMMDEAAKV